MRLYDEEATRLTFAPVVGEDLTGLQLRMHFSHRYLRGTMIYGRFVVPDGGPDALALHSRIGTTA